ncbi:MAG: hypothetical protein KIT42_07220 [Rhodocyclaceae bacterium]|nr:hypothetical protein [Rhodocyclaceae bacterium]MCW5595643.1 hypothetical protein [Rhodocyclaceae bacterium]
MTRKLALLLPVLVLGACATPDKTPPPAAETPLPAPVETTPPVVAKTARPGPIPVRPLNVKTECKFRDETGYNGALKLDVAGAQVHAFEAKVNIPKRGACRFDLKDFHQTRELPAIELSQTRGKCIVRVWEQGERVTVAFQQCEQMCSGSSYPYLWPILNDRRDGSCA